MPCDCKDNYTEVGSRDRYDRMILVDIPPHMQGYKRARLSAGLSGTICIDPCILEEINYLWSLGIVTYGSCCGHNGEREAFVNVSDESINLMLDLGYIQSHPDKNRSDTFILKSIKSHYHDSINR